jgi:quercetin dioxygenase-like cupin family protein
LIEEVVMRFRATGIVLLAGAVVATPAFAQNPPASPAITRTVVAATKLPAVGNIPLCFRGVTVTIPVGEKSSVSTANGMVYQLSGSTEVSLAGEAKTLGVGEGIFIAAGKMASLKAGSGEPSIFLHFLLTPAADLDQSAESAPATVKELYRTAAPIPGLKPGTYDLTLTRIS